MSVVFVENCGISEIMSFVYQRQVRFHETDAAGVVYFANVLTLCHEAYEASLAASGISLRIFFGGDGAIAVPIIHADIDFHRPMFCGDPLKIHLTPQSLDLHTFEINYQITDATDKAYLLAKALTRHVCITVSDRKRHPLSPEIIHWLDQGC